VNAIDVDIDVLTVYQGVLSGLRHRLVSVVCYYGQHYHCFAYNQELARWVMFDDTTVKVRRACRLDGTTVKSGRKHAVSFFFVFSLVCGW
jgi:ubiquitin C-terminal hydrolase